MLLLYHMLASMASGELPFWSGGRALGSRIFVGSLGTAWLEARRGRPYTLEEGDEVCYPALGPYLVRYPLGCL
jgi:hypothetical protein